MMVPVRRLRLSLFGRYNPNETISIRWRLTPEILGKVSFEYILYGLNTGIKPLRDVFQYKITLGLVPEVISHLDVVKMDNGLDYDLLEISQIFGDYFQDMFDALIPSLPLILSVENLTSISLTEVNVRWFGVTIHAN